MRHRIEMLPLIMFLFSSCFGDFDKSEAYFNTSQYDKAIRELNHLLFLNVAEIKALDLRARSYVELKQYEEAIKDYRKILKFDSKNAMAYAGIGRIYWLIHDYPSAEKYLLRAVSIDDENFQVLLLLGRAMIKNKNFQKADEFLYYAKTLEPSEANVYFYRGIAQAHLGDVLGTAAQFNTYLLYAPDNLIARYNRGFAYLQMGLKDWALEDFEYILKENPTHFEALARRGACLKESNPGQACMDLLLAAKNGSKFAQEHIGSCGV